MAEKVVDTIIDPEFFEALEDRLLRHAVNRDDRDHTTYEPSYMFRPFFINRSTDETRKVRITLTIEEIEDATLDNSEQSL